MAGFDEDAAERWMQNRRVRTASGNSTQRLRNTSVGVWEKGYSGGPLRGAVSDRRSEWMGGGMGGRMGEDWRDIAPNTVQRLGSGLDPISAAVVGKFKQRSADKRMAKRGFVPQKQLRTDSGSRRSADEEEGVVEAAPESSTVEPTTPAAGEAPHWARTWAASKAIMNDPDKFAAKRGEFLVRQEQRGWPTPLTPPA